MDNIKKLIESSIFDDVKIGLYLLAQEVEDGKFGDKLESTSLYNFKIKTSIGLIKYGLITNKGVIYLGWHQLLVGPMDMFKGSDNWILEKYKDDKNI